MSLQAAMLSIKHLSLQKACMDEFRELDSSPPIRWRGSGMLAPLPRLAMDGSVDDSTAGRRGTNGSFATRLGF